MNFCKPLGGYFGLDSMAIQNPHANAAAYNSARSALRAVIRAGNIRRIAAPAYTCPVVWDALKAENCEILPYSLTEDLFPQEEIPAGVALLYTDYFGICSRQVRALEKTGRQLIVDCAQAFYAPNRGWASFYSPRKFFGLPDGGLAYCRETLPSDFETDCSYERCSHLLKRADAGAEAGYEDFKRNDAALEKAGLKKMSRLTRRMLENLPYEEAKKRRLENFRFWHEALKKINQLQIELEDGIPLAYPFLTATSTLRQKLINQKVFVPVYWPDIRQPLSAPERFLQTHLLALPLDQRYTPADLQRALEVILNEI